MHRVERGIEPSELAPIQARYTPRWVKFYNDGIGKRPSDRYWSRFNSDLKMAFQGICAYCERREQGEIDHFRPKSRYPHLVYIWSNWIYACPTCNRRKHEKWPPYGFVDPCAQSATASPENYFTFDIETGLILPKSGLSPIRRKKAVNTIRCLRLNKWPHAKNRREWVEIVAATPADKRPHFASRSTPYSSITRVVFGHLGLSY